MRIVFAGDWHADIDAAWAAVKVAAEAGAQWIVHVGDFFYTGEYGHRFLNSLNRALYRHDMCLVFVRGNHDDTNALRRAQAISERDQMATPEGFIPMRQRVFWAPDGLFWNWNGTHFVALGGAESIDRARRTPNKSWWADEGVQEEAVAKAISYGSADVVVMHDVPANVVVRSLVNAGPAMDKNGIIGARSRALLQDAVDALKPSWVFSGHHHSFQRDVLTYEDGTTGQCIILDRGDYEGMQNSPRVLGSSLFLAEAEDGELTHSFFG